MKRSTINNLRCPWVIATIVLLNVLFSPYLPTAAGQTNALPRSLISSSAHNDQILIPLQNDNITVLQHEKGTNIATRRNATVNYKGRPHLEVAPNTWTIMRSN